MKIVSRVLFLLIFVSVVVIVALPSASAMEWNNCCDVHVNNAELESAYHDFVQSSYCSGGTLTDDCLAEANKDGHSLTYFKKVLIDDAKKECLEKTKELKDEFNNGYDGLFGSESFDKIDYFSDSVSFNDPFYQRIDINPLQYDVKNTLWKEPREHPETFWNYRIANSRFSYLKPTSITPSQMTEIYNDQYQKAYETCKEKEYDFELFQSCMQKNTHFSKQETDAYYFYSGLKGEFYIEALGVCEEELGFQNDLGILSFPGQPSKASCTDDELIDGCCPGYHKDKKYGICCSEGYEGYRSTEDNTLLCVPAQQDDEIVSVDIRLSKNNLLLDGKDTIKATLTYTARTPAGELVPYANKEIFHGIVADSPTSQFKFNVKPLSQKTDDEGKLQAVISLKKAQLDLLGLDKKEKTKIYVYSLDQPDSERKQTSFTLSYGEGIHIESIEKVSEGPVWQGAGAEFVVKVNDPLNEKKQYTFTSPSPLRVNGKTQEVIGGDATAYYTTTKNEVPFAWYAPEISKKMKINYAKRIQQSLVKMGLVVAEDFAGNKLGEYTGDAKKMADSSENFNKLNKVYEGMNTLVKTDIQAGGAVQQGNNMASMLKTANEPYQLAHKGISFIMWTEGTIGLLGEPATPLLTTLKVGLTGLDDWYSLVEDLENVAQAKKIRLEFPITVSVKGLSSGSNDTKEELVPVEGFEMVMEG